MMKKNRYNDIHIPEQLADVIHNAQQKAVKRKQSFRIVQYSSLIAACIAFIMIVNISSVASAMSQIPVLGSIVKVLQWGEGGEITDGAQVNTAVVADHIQIHFSHDGKVSQRVPFYTVKHKIAPNRLIFTFEGVRTFDYDKVKQDLLMLPLVRDVYASMILDDSAMGFVVQLQEGVNYSITEFENPGAIELKLNPNTTPTQSQKIFALRTQPMPFGEQMGMLEETYPKEDISFIKIANNQFIGVIGEYATREEAESKLKQITAQTDYNGEFYVDSWMNNELPK
ncbi:hypothetical protein [Paenibacillus kyungheensis]